MPWVRIDENAMDHPKIAGLPSAAFRLWVEGLSYCQRFLTDGVLGDRAVKTLRYYSPRRAEHLVQSRLWDVTTNGFLVHDYLTWNESKEQVLFARDCAKRRVALLRDPELRQAVRDRDGDECRYCGRTVRWNDRKGDLGGTYDHVDPQRGNSLDNLVVCCRGCNSGKGRRTPEEAQMVLRPINIKSKSGSRSNLGQINPATCGVGGKEEREISKRSEGGLGETDLSKRAGLFCGWYEEAHHRHFGVGYMGSQKDYQSALILVSKFTDRELRDAALVWFGMDDDFATSGTRTIPKFASRVTGCLQRIQEQGIA